MNIRRILGVLQLRKYQILFGAVLVVSSKTFKTSNHNFDNIITSIKTSNHNFDNSITSRTEKGLATFNTTTSNHNFGSTTDDPISQQSVITDRTLGERTSEPTSGPTSGPTSFPTSGPISGSNTSDRPPTSVPTSGPISISNMSDRPPLCNRFQLLNGKWIATNTTKSVYGYTRGPQNCRNLKYKTRDTDYEWLVEENCEFLMWNKTEFCNLIKGTPIMLVGDSLTWEHYGALVNSLGGETSIGLYRQSKRENKSVLSAVCDDPQTVMIYRSATHLEQLDMLLNETFPLVLILNRGAHYVEDQEFLSELNTTFAFVQKWQERCQSLGAECPFFWRTTVPGHPGCMNFSKPVTNISWMEEMIAASDPIYHWNDFKRQNEFALDMLQSFGLNNYQIMDAYHMNILRPDSHLKPSPGGGDCLHSCIPGKIDVYNRLLFHYLRMVNAKSDSPTLFQLENFPFPWVRAGNVRKIAGGHLSIENKTF
mmetsp:Transcript_7694/g.18519  ORF Transcript_7694/g.18519 Transcript_7694/m.18519 type:complete len:481 (+) Transcript_7694:107-1549(+)